MLEIDVVIVFLAAEDSSASASASIPSFSSSYDPPKIKRSGRHLPAGLPPGQLLPLRKQIAKGNRQLQEPTSPSDFKPSTEWVCTYSYTYILDMCIHLRLIKRIQVLLYSK